MGQIRKAEEDRQLTSATGAIRTEAQHFQTPFLLANGNLVSQSHAWPAAAEGCTEHAPGGDGSLFAH